MFSKAKKGRQAPQPLDLFPSPLLQPLRCRIRFGRAITQASCQQEGPFLRVEATIGGLNAGREQESKQQLVSFEQGAADVTVKCVGVVLLHAKC